MRLFLILIPLFFSSIIKSQNTLQIFDDFIGKKWVANGTWKDGSTFKQELTFTKDLNGRIIKVQTNGFINSENTAWGKRNFGVRYWDEKSQKILFIEFDVFGGVTTGTAFSNAHGDLLYQYPYHGMLLTERFKKIDDNSYQYIIGTYEDSTFTEQFLSTEYKVRDDKRSFDFWIGEWTVYKYGTDTIVGHSEIKTILNGNALQEFYTNTKKSFEGQSLNKYNTDKGQWEQYWVDNSGTTLHLSGNIIENEMVLVSEISESNVIDKIVWTPQSDSTVRQKWTKENISNGEETIVFDGLYVKK